MDAIDKIQEIIKNILASFANSKHWKIKTLFVCLLLSFFLNTPKYLYFYNYLNGKVIVNKYAALEKQIADPFTQKNYAPESHESKMTFRLTVPLYAKIFHLHSLGVYITQFILGVLSVYFFLLIIFSITDKKEISILSAIAFSTSYMGASAFIDVYGFLDSFVFFFFLVIAYYNNYLLTFLLLFLSYFSDERAVFGSLLLLIWFYLSASKEKNVSFVKNSIAMAIAFLAYGATRLILMKIFHLHMGTGTIGPIAFLQNFNNIGLGILEGMKAFWILIILSAVILYMNGQKLLSISYSAICLLIFSISLLVWDNTRSISYMIISVPIAYFVFARYIKTETFYTICLIVAGLNIFIPLYSVQLELYWINPLFFDIIKKLFQVIT